MARRQQPPKPGDGSGRQPVRVTDAEHPKRHGRCNHRRTARPGATPSSSPRTPAHLLLHPAIREYRGRKDEPKGFGWRDFRNLIVRALIQPGGPVGLVRDDIRLPLTASMREFIAANAEWLTVFQLPIHPSDLNP
ncbi:hypothetical protein AB0D86_26875 [Streptomyces sp. NPDC048324]|uniref:hypothetical protein n=1 Tax=Streptomyces sp. NPDC048324 TaxID=3157205 RepID=UPI003427698E